MVGKHSPVQGAKPIVKLLGGIENNDSPFEYFKKDFLGKQGRKVAAYRRRNFSMSDHMFGLFLPAVEENKSSATAGNEFDHLINEFLKDYWQVQTRKLPVDSKELI
jgi:hypothetical protein